MGDIGKTEESDVKGRIDGLDSIRFVCAFCVVLSHFDYLPFLQSIDKSSAFGQFVFALYKTFINGPAAVIVFFVISGLCIHFPFRHGEKIKLAGYYCRRYLRIGLPLVATLLFANSVGVKFSLFDRWIMWSVFCEEIYYTLYPLLMLIRRILGWKCLIPIAFLLALLVCLSNPYAGNYPSFGWTLNWILGLPCWLIGCHLAELCDSLPTKAVKRQVIWVWRVSIWFTSWVCLLLRFHSPIGYPWTLNFFAVQVYLWLKREIPYLRTNKPSAFLESGGRWSYSIYLMHVPISAAITGVAIAVPFLDATVGWFLKLLSIMIGCFLFYLAIEKPSHKIAKQFEMVDK